MKLAPANADCKRCLDEVDAACDALSALVKELCQRILEDQDQRRLERQDLRLKLLREVSSGHELRQQLQLVEEQRNGRQSPS